MACHSPCTGSSLCSFSALAAFGSMAPRSDGLRHRHSVSKAFWAASIAFTVVSASPAWTVVMTSSVAGFSRGKRLEVSLQDHL